MHIYVCPFIGLNAFSSPSSWQLQYISLPAATKLGQGNIFTSVCLSTRGGWWWPGPGGCLQFFEGGCLQFFGGRGIYGVSPIFCQGGVSIFSGGCLQFFGGSPIFFLFFFNFISPQKKVLLRYTNPPPPDGQCAAGTHPTGMHSCFEKNTNSKRQTRIFTFT